MQINSMFVDKFYRMDPEFEDIVFSGAELQVGMIVLLEESLLREDIREGMNRYEIDKALEVNRWCIIERIETLRRFEHDETGYAIHETEPLIRFIGVYPDGEKRSRSYSSGYSWIVKKESIPKERN